REKRQLRAMENRRELLGVSRRDLLKAGLLTSAGYLVAKKGLSARAADADDDDVCISPPTRAFIDPLPIPPVQRALDALDPAPTLCPNTAAGEGRPQCHQALKKFPPSEFYGVTQKDGQVSVSPDLQLQAPWRYALATHAMH